MTHGASPVTLHRPWLFLTPEPQHDAAPPGLPEQPEPPHSPQLSGQQTASLALMPGMPPGHVVVVVGGGVGVGGVSERNNNRHNQRGEDNGEILMLRRRMSLGATCSRSICCHMFATLFLPFTTKCVGRSPPNRVFPATPGSARVGETVANNGIYSPSRFLTFLDDTRGLPGDAAQALVGLDAGAAARRGTAGPARATRATARAAAQRAADDVVGVDAGDAAGARRGGGGGGGRSV